MFDPLQTKALPEAAPSSSSGGDPEQVEAIVSAAGASSDECRQILQELAALLLPVGGKTGGKTSIRLGGLSKDKNGGSSPLDPQWVRRVAFIARTLGPWASLLLKTAQHSLPRDQKDGKNQKETRSNSKGGAKGSDGLKQLGALVQGVLDAVLKVLDPLQRCLGDAEDEMLTAEDVER